jgi:Plasmid pRiA4b ORF-3-like protein
MKEELFQFKVTLKGSVPKIWRRFLVENDITFDRLHLIIQSVMGWENYHMYTFNVKKQHLLMPEMDAYSFGEWCPYTNEVNIAELVTRVKQKFQYIYDFGDDWQHEIVFEKRVPATGDMIFPICLDGEHACPPEDCGGIVGFYAEEKDSTSNLFNIDKVNNQLRNLDK